MRRREFTALLGGAAVGWPLAARAQQRPTKIPRIGIIDDAPIWDHFRGGLRELGYIEGRDIVFEYRSAEGQPHRLAVVASDLASVPVDIIATSGSAATRAAQQATTTIPIVMIGTLDPVGFGLVANLARPGGNVTGLCVDASAEMSGKNLSLLMEIVPGLSRIGVLQQVGYQAPELEVAAQKLNVELFVVDVRTNDELESAFAAMRRKRVGAMIVRGSLFFVRRQQVADLALKHRLPAFHGLKEYAQAGLLMTYGANLPDLYRRAGSYVDRIAKGAKPGDLPVEQPTKFDLVINLRTAKALGLTVPQSLLLRANEIIR